MYDDDQENYKPALDSKTLVLPPNVRGIVLGCSLRSEGGFQPIQNLVSLAERWEAVSNKLQNNMIEPPSQEARRQLKERNKLLKSRASELEMARRKHDENMEMIQEKQALLETLENEVEKTMKKVRLQQELTLISKETKLATTEALLMKSDEEGSGQRTKDTNQEKGLHESIKKINKQIASHCISITGGLNKVSILRDQMAQVIEEIKSLEEEIEASSINTDEQRLRNDLKKFEREQLRLAQEQKNLALKKLKEEGEELVPDQNRVVQLRQHLSCALQQSGTSLIGALVIGFDMESEGLSGALARVFPRVGAINFSSSYADYENPFKVLNSKYYYFNVVVPEYAVASDALVERDLPDDLKTKAEKVSVSEKVLDAMTEVWKENYREMRRRDEIEKFETGCGGRRTRELGIYKSNYVVIGPVKSNLHITTIDMILSRHQAHLAYNVVILVLKPVVIGGTLKHFCDYRPPQKDYDEIFPLNIKLGECQSWLKSTTEGTEVGSAVNPFRIGVEHTVVEYNLKMFRRK